MASAAGGGGGPPPQEEDWRRKLVPEDRRRIVQKIINVLKDCATDASGSTDEPRLAALAARYEGTVYSTAPNNSEYFRQIANKLYTLQKKGQQVRASAAAAAAAGGGGGVPQPPQQQPQPQQPPPPQQQRITQQQPQQLTALHQHHQQQRAAHHQQQQQAQQMVTNNGASMIGTGLAPANTAAMLQHQQQAMSSQQQVLNFKNQPQAQQQQPPQQLTPAQIASLQQQQQQRGANPTVTTPAQRQAASQMMTGMPQQQTPQPHQPPLRATATAGQSNGIHHPHQPHHLVTPQQQTQQQRMATGAATPSAAAIHHGQIGGAGTMSKLKTTLANTVTPSGGQPTITSTTQPLSSSAMQTTSSSAPTNATTGSAETKPDPERLYWDKVRWMQQYLRPMMVMIRQIEKLKESIKVSPVTDPDKANKQRNLEGIHKKMTYIQRLVQHPSSGTDYVIQYQTLEAAERQIKHWLNQLQRDPSSSSSSTSAAAQQGPIGTGGPQPQATLSSGHGTVAATSGTVPTAPASTHFMPSGGTAYAPALASNQQQPIKSAAAIPSAGGYHPQPSSHPHPSHHPLHTKGSPSSAVPSATAPSPPSAASMGTTAPPAGTSTSPRLATPHQYPHSTPPPVAPSALIGSSPPQLAPEPSGKHAGTPPLPHSTTGAASLVSTPPTAAPAATTTVKTEAPPASPQTPPQQQNVIQSFVERIRSLSPEAISRVANLFDETFSKVAAGSTMPGSSSHLPYLPDTPFNSLPGSHCSSSPDNPLGLATSHNEPPLKKTKLQGLKEAAPNDGVSSSSHSALFTMLSRPQTNALDESLWFGGLQHSPSPSRISKRKMTSA